MAARYWFGIGASTRLYNDEKVAGYNRTFRKPLFVVALSLQAFNEAVEKHLRKEQSNLWKFKTPRQFVEAIHGLREKWVRVEQVRAQQLRGQGYNVITVTEISEDPAFRQIMKKLRTAAREREGVAEQIARATAEVKDPGKLHSRFGWAGDFAFSIFCEYTLH
jgi:hypothetical protein